VVSRSGPTPGTWPWYDRVVERTLEIFESFEAAGRADHAYYASLTPQERLDLVLVLSRRLWEQTDGPPSRLERVHRGVDLASR
jgi:hypothetical protein